MEQASQSRIAFLETQIDYLETELVSLNDLLIQCGFPHGIKTLRSTVKEILGSGNSEDENI